MLPIEIKGFPMPPSANALYANGHKGRFKTQKYESYELEVARWAHKNAHQLQTARLILDGLERDQALFIHRDYFHKAYRILSDANKPIRNDSSNRIKALDDILSKLLGIDDSMFWGGSYNKWPSHHVALGEFVNIRITAIPLPAKPKDAE